ncbi:neprilysin-1-like protein [Leptotrombidium deliense]|uniref:Neprilysin-1-like protein n=1 Tax=Leptotrombidium deliense TaxID=299467 RepID=A0A443SAH0_9ACAR|nr:neprilysin-1-like protein [Leptotrombidium deliense]
MQKNFVFPRNEKQVLCATLTEHIFGLALSRYYVKFYLQDSTVQEMKAFVTEVKAALSKTLQSNEWMDEKTKSKAQLKLHRMISYIAIPSWIATDDDLNKVYDDMNKMQNGNYLENQITANEWLSKQALKRIRSQNESIVDLLRGGPSEVNAFYALMENIFRVKIGVLNQPFYYHNAPFAVNFGSMGYVLGHEILHGFDNRGAQYDYVGHKKMWWSNETWEVYQKKVQCFVDQYNEFIEPVTGQKARALHWFYIDFNFGH